MQNDTEQTNCVCTPTLPDWCSMVWNGLGLGASVVPQLWLPLRVEGVQCRLLMRGVWVGGCRGLRLLCSSDGFPQALLDWVGFIHWWSNERHIYRCTHTNAYRLLQLLHPQMPRSLRHPSSVWDYLLHLILSPTLAKMSQSAGGVRVTCGAHRAADWRQTTDHPGKALSARPSANSHWSRNILIMPGLHSPGWALSSDSLIIFQIQLSRHHKLQLTEYVEITLQHK